MKQIMKIIKCLLPALIFYVLGYLVISKSSSSNFSKLHSDILHYAPYILLLLGSALAWRFNRSRTFFMILLFMLSLFVIRNNMTERYRYQEFYILLTIILPINLVIFTLLKERGIISFWGMTRFAFILSQFLFVYWLSSSSREELFNQIVRISVPIYQGTDTMIAATIFAFAFSLAVLLLRTYFYRSVQEVCFVGVLPALFLAFKQNNRIELSIYFSIIGLIFIFSVLQETHLMAFYDELTGLPSRRSLNQDMMKLGMKYSIAMVDIDYFKKFNDSYGHDTGDEALRFVAAMIQDVKGGGKAYRYGGEEFTILFSGKGTTEVIPILEELRKTIATKDFVVRKKRKAGSSRRKSCSSTKKRTGSKRKGARSASSGKKRLYIHVSIGVAQKEETHKTPELVLNAADKALYRAKKKGRNCVCK